MWLQLSQISKKITEGNVRKFTDSFAFSAHIDVINRRALTFSFKNAQIIKEYPCSPVVTFPSFGSERHGVRPHREILFQCLCWTQLLVLVLSSFFRFNQVSCEKTF